MRPKSMVLMGLALACGLVAAIGISQFLEARNKRVEETDKQPIFVALTDIGTNEELTPQNIKLEEWPRNIIPQGALTKLEEVEGKRCRTKLYAGDPILLAKLLGAGDSTGAAKDIPPGYRIAHVSVDSVTGSSNLILPGDRVDVMVFRAPTSDMGATAAKIVLQDIKVFAVDTHTATEFTNSKADQSEPMTAKLISLLVTPQQALILHAATNAGGSGAARARNPDDDVHVNDEGVNLADIFGPDRHSDRTAEGEEKHENHLTGLVNPPASQPTLSQPAVPEPDAPIVPAVNEPRRTMVVIMGGQVSEVDFPRSGGLPVSQPEQTLNGGGNPPSQLMSPPQQNNAPSSPEEQ